MLLVESAGKALLRQAGVAVPAGLLVERASQVSQWTGGYPIALKAQVPSGGRGRAGGVVRAGDAREARQAAARLLATPFAEGPPRSLLLEPWLACQRELYLCVTIDAGSGGYAVLYSAFGGMDVEQHPPVSLAVGTPGSFRGAALRRALLEAERDPAIRERVIALARRLLDLASAADALTVEINPLGVTERGALVALDAKVVRDEAAAFRQGDVAGLIEAERLRQHPAVAKALAGNLMFVRLEGEVGLISGGAGMTLAAMDLIADAGAHPACFLDCSANPTPQGYGSAFEILDGESSVRAILVSIFGGGTQMDRVARVMIELMGARTSAKPVVFRLQGTGIEQANALMSAAGLRNHAVLEEAVAEAVRLARHGE